MAEQDTWEYWSPEKWIELLNNTDVKIDDATKINILQKIEILKNTFPGWVRYTKAGELNMLFYRLGILKLKGRVD